MALALLTAHLRTHTLPPAGHHPALSCQLSLAPTPSVAPSDQGTFTCHYKPGRVIFSLKSLLPAPPTPQGGMTFLFPRPGPAESGIHRSLGSAEREMKLLTAPPGSFLQHLSILASEMSWGPLGWGHGRLSVNV